MIKAYLVDDEQPALDRLSRMLKATNRVEIVGASVDPVRAIEELSGAKPDVLFLDIHMPGLSGFELLRELPYPPLIIFATAYDEYALEAFRENSVDYLVKPVSAEELDRALAKVDRFVQGTRDFDVAAALNRIASALDTGPGITRLTHLTSQVGQKLKIIDLVDVTHIFAQDKLTHAVTPEKSYFIDQTIAELEAKLDPARFFRIHRGVILNFAYLEELHAYFGGRAVARLKDSKGTELTVARSRVRALKERLGMR
jgi:two-component system LytT family response regulator